MKNILAPSILSADFNILGEQLKTIEENGAGYIHFDVMDGMFVPSISFGMPVMKSIKDTTNMVMDAHLMVEEPIRYIDDFKASGADIITVHVEACKDVHATLEKIHSVGLKAGLTLNPPTSVEELKPYLDEVDMFLIMTVNPGFGGQKLIPECIDKARTLRGWLNEKGLETDIEVDGGIKANNVHLALEAGINVVVAGSAVFGGDVAANTKEFVEIMK